jgi:hypothetical protein
MWVPTTRLPERRHGKLDGTTALTRIGAVLLFSSLFLPIANHEALTFREIKEFLALKLPHFLQ